MKFVKRLGFYLLGFSIGLVFLVYFLKGKNTEFCYSPNCRVLKNISTKTIEFSPGTALFFLENGIDSSGIRTVLRDGDVIFSKSSPREKPCASYVIEAVVRNKSVEILIENCDSVAAVKKINLIP